METLESKKTEITGVLKGYKANKHGDIDALELDSENGTYKINFRPHTAKAIMDAAKPGEKLSIAYEEKQPKHDPKGDKKPKLELQSLTTSDGNELAVSSIHPEKPKGGQAEHLKFESFELVKSKKDDLIGIRSGKKFVHVHKEDKEWADTIKKDSAVEITAVKRADDGFVNENHDEVYHIQTIRINGKEYSSKK